jgi:hypothetical protein
MMCNVMGPYWLTDRPRFQDFDIFLDSAIFKLGQ